MCERFRRVVHAPAGFVVVCGPTGSGKTTTLYAAMRERNVGGHQLCSIEDPVEIRLPGVAQVQVNLRAGLTFASGLRAFLRQDPNVMMIGEMRDAETAAVATSAALCGQLVLTTLHSNDALCALERLVELGLSPRGVAASVTAIVSQRLVRRLCGRCKRDGVAGVSAQAFGIAPGSAVAEAAGCTACYGGGYRGRRGIFEIVEMSPDFATPWKAHRLPQRCATPPNVPVTRRSLSSRPVDLRRRVQRRRSGTRVGHSMNGGLNETLPASIRIADVATLARSRNASDVH